jgi:hypothetical protein
MLTLFLICIKHNGDDAFEETSLIEGFIFVKLSESVYCMWAYRFEEKNVEMSTFYWNLLYGNQNFKSFVETI